MRLTTTALAAVVAVLATLVPATAATTAATAAGGRTHGDPERFKQGCRTYTYDYRIRTPYDDWTLDVWIRNPRGKSVHFGGWLGKPGRQGHPRRQRNNEWTMCSRSSRPGRYTIRAKLTWYVPQESLPFVPPPPPEEHVKWLPVERFRLWR